MKTYKISDARKNLINLVKQVHLEGSEFNITVNGVQMASVISTDELESLKETVEILADKELMKSIKEGEKDIQEGNLIPFEDILTEHETSNTLYKKGKERS